MTHERMLVKLATCSHLTVTFSAAIAAVFVLVVTLVSEASVSKVSSHDGSFWRGSLATTLRSSM